MMTLDAELSTHIVLAVQVQTVLTNYETHIHDPDCWHIRTSGLCPSFGILNARKHHVSETGSKKMHLSGEPQIFLSIPCTNALQ
jgi:hypothetical protein